MTTGLTYFFIICVTVITLYATHEICQLIRQKMMMSGPCKALTKLKKDVLTLRLEVHALRRYLIRSFRDAG